MSATLSQVLITARTYLNDDNATQFPDQVLIPKIQEAHRELQEELWQVGSPVVRSSIPSPVGLSSLLVPAGQSIVRISSTLENSGVLTSGGFAVLPNDFLCPTAVFEGGATGITWVPMTEVFYIDTNVVTWSGKFGVWSWIQEALTMPNVANMPIGGTYLKVLYRRQIPIPAIATDPIGILFGESYLAARAAAMAAGTLGNSDVYQGLTTLSKDNLAKVLAANRGQQKPNLRP